MFGKRKQQAVPYPYENYFTPGPNPAPGLTTAEYHDPNRAHAPIADNKPWWYPHAGAVPGVQRVPGAHTPIPVREVDTPIVWIPASGIQVPIAHYKRGWAQAFVPEDGMRHALQAQTPLLQLSAPIRYNIKDSVSTTKRRNVKLRAPKAKE